MRLSRFLLFTCGVSETRPLSSQQPAATPLRRISFHFICGPFAAFKLGLGLGLELGPGLSPSVCMGEGEVSSSWLDYILVWLGLLVLSGLSLRWRGPKTRNSSSVAVAALCFVIIIICVSLPHSMGLRLRLRLRLRGRGLAMLPAHRHRLLLLQFA